MSNLIKPKLKEISIVGLGLNNEFFCASINTGGVVHIQPGKYMDPEHILIALENTLTAAAGAGATGMNVTLGTNVYNFNSTTLPLLTDNNKLSKIKNLLNSDLYTRFKNWFQELNDLGDITSLNFEELYRSLINYRMFLSNVSSCGWNDTRSVKLCFGIKEVGNKCKDNTTKRNDFNEKVYETIQMQPGNSNFCKKLWFRKQD